MLISLFPTPFDHYHLHGSGGLILWYDLRLRRNNADDGNDDNGIFYDNEKTKTHPNDMTLKSKYTNSSITWSKGGSPLGKTSPPRTS